MSRPNVPSAVMVLAGADRDKVKEALDEVIAAPRAAEVAAANVGNVDLAVPVDRADHPET
jgi:hypothetical protein